MAAITPVSALLTFQPTRRAQVRPFPDDTGSQISYFSFDRGGCLHSRPKKLELSVIRAERKPNWLPTALGIGDVSDNYARKSQLPSDVVIQLYASINNKNIKMLNGYFSADCVFEDLAFSKPFQGVKEVEIFLKDLVAVMGDNVKFVLHEVQYGSELTAAVMWHLEWNGKTIPFTRGCSFFECQKDGEQLLITKAHVVAESPFKPGRPVLELLKIVTSVFDNYPDIAEWFLQKPYVIFDYATKMYKIFLQPLVLPLLIYYSQLWKYIVNAVRSFVNMIVMIIRNIK